jgi:hypothetical protein
MGSVARTITKPFEWLGEAAKGLGGIISPKMPEIPAVTYTPPETPAEPAGPGASASESSEAQNERLRILSAKARKKTRTLLTGAQGIQEAAGAVKKKLLGE